MHMKSLHSSDALLDNTPLRKREGGLFEARLPRLLHVEWTGDRTSARVGKMAEELNAEKKLSQSFLEATPSNDEAVSRCRISAAILQMGVALLSPRTWVRSRIQAAFLVEATSETPLCPHLGAR